MTQPQLDWFPLAECPGIPINAHPGAFGCARRHNFHEGVDLYGRPGNYVRAIRDGVVVANRPFTGPVAGCSWWLDTDAVLVQDETGFFCYGELKSSLKLGESVKRGQVIGSLVPVLPREKFRSDIPGHSVTMLHLERYSSGYHPDLGWASWAKREDRPDYLEDPTPILIAALSSRGDSPTLLPL